MVEITFEEFKTKFDRDFTFSETLPDIREVDFDNAYLDANSVFNQSLIPAKPDDSIAKNALLNLTAHFLSLNIDASETGAQARFLQSSRSAGGMSESLQIPSWVSDNDVFSQFATTSFGLKYLIISKPYLDGAIYVVGGQTLP
jgi:hypothetical protein